LSGEDQTVKHLLDGHGSILYLYEPAKQVDQPPLTAAAPSLSTLSPRQDRIKEYLKESPHLLYMPVAEYNELECIAEEEMLDLNDLKRNFDIFGGIFRYSLIATEQECKERRKIVEARCSNVTGDMLRSMGLDIDDDQKSTTGGNISGFILSYCDVPMDGDNPFRSPSLTFTSDFVRQTVLNKMNLDTPRQHLEQLANVLHKESRDITGKDLEVSVVHMLSAGPRKVVWEYQGVLGEPDTNVRRLGHRKRKINQTEFKEGELYYSSNPSYPLADCVLVIKDVFAFQTTWRSDHAFKLGTLKKFRDRLKLSSADRLNLLFVNPEYTNTYQSRHRDKYLAKGEDPNKPILDSTKTVLLSAQDVATMWNNTRIFVAFPKGKDWHGAIRKALDNEV